MDTVKKESLLKVIEFIEKECVDTEKRWEMIKSVVENSIRAETTASSQKI